MNDTELRSRGGRKPTFGKEDVAKAVNDLLAEGQEASVRAARQRLGRGSFTTIAAMMREVKDEAAGPEGPARSGRFLQCGSSPS